ncbi:hypothetical protein A2U01_0118015, partial [Trifolium medium]|nr:hypothetical protein [Trifolium medium]
MVGEVVGGGPHRSNNSPLRCSGEVAAVRGRRSSGKMVADGGPHYG